MAKKILDEKDFKEFVNGLVKDLEQQFDPQTHGEWSAELVAEICSEPEEHGVETDVYVGYIRGALETAAKLHNMTVLEMLDYLHLPEP